MEKKLNVSLPALVVMAFIGALLRSELIILLILGYTLLVEKDEWASVQITKALYFAFAYDVILLVLRECFKVMYFTVGRIGFLNTVLSFMDSLVFMILAILYIVVNILAILKVVKSNDAVIPGIDKLASNTYSIINK